ncbi:MAG: serine/threonine-protein kinase, partial [Patescibacteria group bacterium]
MTDHRTTDDIVFDFETGEPPVALEERTQYTFGPYRILRKLGEGGMASVFLVEIRGAFDFRKVVALKLMHAQIMRETVQRQMFVNEVRLGGMLQHPNIVQMFDCGLEGNQPFCTMEFVNGWSLERILGRCREMHMELPPSVIAEVLRAVCDGLHFAHTFVHEGAPLDLVHRDVKPANVLISRHGEVKVADFGIAKAAVNVHHTQAGVARGTAMYMSPEQTLGRDLDCRSDVFSVGSMLYFALTGMFAFWSGDPNDHPLADVMATMHAVLQCERTFAVRTLAEHHPAFLDAFSRATEKKREERCASAELLGTELAEIRA